MQIKKKKSSVVFCWVCGRQLYGYKGKKVLVRGNMVTIHKACEEDIERKDEYVPKVLSMV